MDNVCKERKILKYIAKIFLIILLILGILFLSFYMILVTGSYLDKKNYGSIENAGLADDLNLKQSNFPHSIKNTKCITDPGMSDYLRTCYFEIEPKEFNMILTGYDFKEDSSNELYKNKNNTSYTVTIKNVYIGSEFLVNKSYTTLPPDFKNGGHVKIFTNAANNQVILDIYRE